MIAAYREPDRARGRELMVQLIESLSQGVPTALTEVITLGRTLTEVGTGGYWRPKPQEGSRAVDGRLGKPGNCDQGTARRNRAVRTKKLG